MNGVMVRLMSSTGHLLTTEQAAQRLGKSGRTVRRMVVTGRLVPAIRLPGENGAYLFEPSDVDAIARIEAAQAAS